MLSPKRKSPQELLQDALDRLDSVVTRYKSKLLNTEFESLRGTRRNSLHSAWQFRASA